MRRFKDLFVIFLVLFSLQTLLLADYPFGANGDTADILAYWYNVKPDKIEMMPGRQFLCTSQLQIYMRTREDGCAIKADVYFKDGKLAFSRSFDWKKGRASKEYYAEVRNGFLQLTADVPYLNDLPARIVIRVQSGKSSVTKDIPCRYHEVKGQVTDPRGGAMKAHVIVAPDGFPNDAGVGVNCDERGRYSLSLPERTYNCIICSDKTYGQTTLEPWAWHIILDSDERLDFTIGNGEVYNLMVWASNGGGRTFFVSFRPMALYPRDAEREMKYPVKINGLDYTAVDICPPLEMEDIQVTFNGKKARILSCQKYFETMSDKTAMPACLVQVAPENLSENGKTTVRVEYRKSIKVKDREFEFYSMGYYQFLPNFSGHSYYY